MGKKKEHHHKKKNPGEPGDFFKRVQGELPSFVFNGAKIHIIPEICKFLTVYFYLIVKNDRIMDDRNKNKVDKTVNNNIIDESKIEEIAKKFLRIGGKWYKKAKDPITRQEALYPIQAAMLIADEGKDIGNKVLKAAPKYLAQTNIPSHTDYQECVSNGDGENFYNIYRPIKYSPAEGQWPHIEQLIRHIFGEQYEMGLDYIQLLYLKPMRKLPILLLVSHENNTGKSTFCNFLNEVFGENVTPMTNETLQSKFTAPWVNKLLVFVEEKAKRDEDQEKLKNMVTAKTLPSEGKGTDWHQAIIFVKVILCSNNEFNPVVIESEDTRYWVRRVPPLSVKSQGEKILDACEKEIPAFLQYLLNRKMYTEDKNRLWFDPLETRTQAWWKIVEGSESKLDSELRELLIDIMDQTGNDIIEYDAKTLSELCCYLGLEKKTKRSISINDIRTILYKWGLTTGKKAERIHYYWKYSNLPDAQIERKEKIGKKIIITRKNIEHTEK